MDSSAEDIDRAALARPGRGGRQPRKDATAQTEATEALRDAVGDPAAFTSGGTRVERFIAERSEPGNPFLDPAGDGLLAGRLSYQDIQRGETIMGQIHGLSALAEKQGLCPREILVSTNNSGFKRFSDRDDFSIIREEIAAGRIKWVAFRSAERIGREMLPTLQFYELLRKTNTDLYLTSLGRKVDWKEDQLHLRALGMVAEHEGTLIKERTHTAIKRRWVEEGRGWPGSQRLGFRRNEFTKFLEVDPEQWPFIEQIHYGYGKTGAREQGSVRALARELAAKGFPISEDRLRKVLQDPIYVTGEWFVKVDGVPVACRPAELARPIPVEVFETNQRLLRVRKGRHTLTPLGTFVLNRVRVYHARCQDQRVSFQDREMTPMLRRRRWSGGRKGRTRDVYAHQPVVPDCCRGYTIDALTLEKAVLGALRELALSPDLQTAWTQAAFPEATPRNEVVDGSAREALEARLKVGQNQLARLNREWSDRLLDGETLRQEDFERMVGPVHAQIDGIERQLHSIEAVTCAREQYSVRVDERTRVGLAQRLQEVLTDECPQDPELRLRRAAFVEGALSAVIIHDVPAEPAPPPAAGVTHLDPSRRPQLESRSHGRFRLELRGPLLPEGAQLVEGFDPLAHGQAALSAKEEERSAA